MEKKKVEESDRKDFLNSICRIRPRCISSDNLSWEMKDSGV